MSALNVFLSYSQEDSDLLEELERHLAALKRQGRIQTWHKGQIEAGESWYEQINEQLETAEVILLLLSPSFIASEDCWGVEAQRALERSERGEARVLSVIMRPCEWQATPFVTLQTLPASGQAITSWDNRDQAWLAVAQGLRQVLEPKSMEGNGSSRHTRWAALLFLTLLPVVLVAMLIGLRTETEQQAPTPPAEMVAFREVSFLMGSSATEIEQAFEWCQQLAANTCRQETFAREQPEHLVVLSPFAIDVVEVSRRAFAGWLNQLLYVEVSDGFVSSQGLPLLFLEGSGFEFQAGKGFSVQKEQESLPTTRVTWFGARAYCLAQGKRLPSEAEWEAAARGAAHRHQFPWGDKQPECSDVVFARRANLPCTAQKEGPVAVSNELGDRTPEGILHLGGNVSEWVEDTFAAYPICRTGCRNPVRDGGSDRVFRGGNWGSLAELTRAAGRNLREPDKPHGGLGFRCAQTRPKPTVNDGE